MPLLYTVSPSRVGAEEVILVLGDSLSAAHGMKREQGWVALLEERLRRRSTEGTAAWRVANASVSGETAAGGLARLPALLERHQPGLCIIELGANDGLRGLNTEHMRARLGRIITLCKSRAQVLLLGMKLPPNYGQRHTAAFAASFAALAEEHDVPLLPFLLEGVALNPQLMRGDGLHPTAEAQTILLDNVWQALAPLL